VSARALVFFGIVFAVALGVLLLTAESGDRPRVEATDALTAPEFVPAISKPPDAPAVTRLTGPAMAAPEVQRPEANFAEVGLADKTSILSALEEAAITYDAAQLPVIAPHLTSPDAEVRAAAVEAVMLLGDSSGARLLRQAAAQARSGEEAAQLRAKADYLDLPPASLFTPEDAAAIRARAGLGAHAPAVPATGQ